MLNGNFANCYGLKQFQLSNINFSQCNKAIIYAPNGVMKSSLSQVFDDISKGKPTKDRIFNNVVSAYSITHYTSQYTFSSANPSATPSATDRIYVVNTFADSFEFTKETVSTLLADETTRNAYNVLMEQFSGEVRQIEEKLRSLTGLTKPQIKGKLINDLGLSATADWTDIFEKIHESLTERETLGFLDDCQYAELFNDKVLAIYSKREFINSIEEYITNLNSLPFSYSRT